MNVTKRRPAGFDDVADGPSMDTARRETASNRIVSLACLWGDFGLRMEFADGDTAPFGESVALVPLVYAAILTAEPR